MAKNHEDKVYAGGIRNRINRVVMRTGGRSVAHYNNGHTDQHNSTTAYSPRSLIERTTSEPPTERNRQQNVKDNDV